MPTSPELITTEPPRPPGQRSEPEDEGNVAFFATLNSILAGETPVVLHFQPIVDLKRGIITGYEALARFPPALGPSPDVCFAAAALVGKRLELEQVTSLTALLSKDLLPPDCFLSINVSPTFLISPHWQTVLASVPNLNGIVIEVTEDESIRDYAPFGEKLAQIRALGGVVAVDDFGAGYASMQHILEIKPSFIKLDRAFISGCDVDRARSVMIEMMGRVANRLDAWVVAEGIETQQELAELIQLGAPLGQGYFLGRPNPVMQCISPEKTAWIQSRIVKISSPDRLAAHTEVCPAAATREEALQWLSAIAGGFAAVTDAANRPLHVYEQHPLVGARCLPALLKIQLSSDPVEVLQRALTRPATYRFDPFVVVDERGALQGIIHMDRLMSALLEPKPPPDERPSSAPYPALTCR